MQIKTHQLRGFFFVFFLAFAFTISAPINVNAQSYLPYAPGWYPLATNTYASWGVTYSDSLQYAISCSVGSISPTPNCYSKPHGGRNGVSRFLPWTRIADIPTPRGGLTAAATSDGKVYTFGGCINGSSSFCISDVVEAYDPGTNTWTSKAPMPTPRSFAKAIMHDNLIYVIGGLDIFDNGLATVECYNPANNTWSTKAAMGTPRVLFGAAINHPTVIQQTQNLNKIFVAGGGTYLSYGYVLTPPLASMEIYDIPSNTWSFTTPMPNGGSVFGMDFDIFGTLIIAGGIDWFPSLPNGGERDRMLMRDMNTGSWSLNPIGFDPNVYGFTFRAFWNPYTDSGLFVGMGHLQSGSGYFESVYVQSLPEYNLAFTAKQIEGEAQLEWNNPGESVHHFNLERKQGGNSTFEAIASNIPNTTHEVQFSYADKSLSSGAITYKLLAYDVDGNLLTEAIQNLMVSSSVLMANVNYAIGADYLEVAFSLPENVSSGQLQISTIDGKILLNENLRTEDSPIQIQRARFAKGVYILTLIASSERKSQKFLMQ